MPEAKFFWRCERLPARHSALRRHAQRTKAWQTFRQVGPTAHDNGLFLAFCGPSITVNRIDGGHVNVKGRRS